MNKEWWRGPPTSAPGSCFSLLIYLRGSNRVPVDEEPRVHIYLPRKRKVSSGFGVTKEDMVPEAER